MAIQFDGTSNAGDGSEYLTNPYDAGAAPVRKRWVIPVVIAMTLALLVIAVVIGWNVWTSSPTYSLKQIARAIENQDSVAVARYIDSEGIALDLFKGAGKALSDSTDIALVDMIVTPAFDLIAPVGAGLLAPQVESMAMSFGSETDNPVAALSGKHKIERNGDSAAVAFTGDDGYEVILEMTFDGEIWRVTGVANASEVADTFLPDIEKLVPIILGMGLL